jgi:hypothetical protein
MVRTLAIVLLACSTGSLSPAMSPQQRREYRDQLLQILPKSPEFEAWIDATDELPPDFDALPRRNMLPDPLTFQDGRPVQSRENWAERRAELLKLFERYWFGTLPPDPEIASVDVQESTDEGYSRLEVVLHYGTQIEFA